MVQLLKVLLATTNTLCLYFTSLDIASTSIEQRYDTYSKTYEVINGGQPAEVFGMNELRKQAGARAYGNLLEIAVGTGLQAKYYNQASLQSYKGVDISPGMLRQAQKSLTISLPNTQSTLEIMNAQALAYNANSFDTVIDTFSLCVIPQPGLAIQEMARVVKPDGKVILLENTKSDNFVVATLQVGLIYILYFLLHVFLNF